MIEWIQLTLTVPYIPNFLQFLSIYIALGTIAFAGLSFRAALKTGDDRRPPCSFALYVYFLIIWPYFFYMTHHIRNKYG